MNTQSIFRTAHPPLKIPLWNRSLNWSNFPFENAPKDILWYFKSVKISVNMQMSNKIENGILIKATINKILLGWTEGSIDHYYQSIIQMLIPEDCFYWVDFNSTLFIKHELWVYSISIIIPLIVIWRLAIMKWSN